MQDTEPGWSEPVLLYDYPENSVIRIYGTGAYEGRIYAVQQQFDTTGGNIHYSRVSLLKKDSEPDIDLDIVQLSSEAYPAEQPLIFRSHSGDLHLFWGERRVDPEFEQWQTPLPFGLATSLIYTEVNQGVIGTPQEIYEGGLSEFSPQGTGELRLPANVTKSTTGELYTVFGAEGTFGDFAGSSGTGSTFLSRSKEGTWNDAQYLLPFRFSQNIAASSEGNLIIPHIGASPFLPGGDSNDLYIITSEDGGKSWKDETLVFKGGEEVLSYLYIEASPTGQFYLIWGQNRNSGFSVFPDIMWYSISDDGGMTWSEPKIFFDVQRPSQNQHHFIRSSDMVIDRAGRVHWAGVTHQGDVNGIERSVLQHKVWDPEAQSWSHSEVVQAAENPGQVYLSIDMPENKLYLFWEIEKEESFGLTEAMYYSVLDLGDVNRLPVVSESGPLQVHANYPNPFATATTIPFTLKETGEVVLNVYDIGGRRLLKKDLGVLPEGFYHERLELDMFSSGMYIYELIVNGMYRQEEKMIVVK